MKATNRTSVPPYADFNTPLFEPRKSTCWTSEVNRMDYGSQSNELFRSGERAFTLNLMAFEHHRIGFESQQEGQFGASEIIRQLNQLNFDNWVDTGREMIAWRTEAHPPAKNSLPF